MREIVIVGKMLAGIVAYAIIPSTASTATTKTIRRSWRAANVPNPTLESYDDRLTRT
ncbi:MAG: hypothetical protein WB810_11955 [Candidatus Cybelea sp.]